MSDEPVVITDELRAQVLGMATRDELKAELLRRLEADPDQGSAEVRTLRTALRTAF